MNQVRIIAIPIAHSALRHTPAGIAVSEASFRHQEAVIEAGVERQLDFECAAIALGPVAMALEREPLGQALELEGFIAPRTRRSNPEVALLPQY